MEAQFIMMPMTRPGIVVLLDRPDERGLVVSAYADMTVQDGFHRYVEQNLENLAAEAAKLLSGADARKALEENLDVIREAIRTEYDPTAAGMAIFSGASTKLRHVMNLEFPVENRLVIDEEPFVLPLLERWYGEPPYLVALFDSNEAQLFEARHGRSEPLDNLSRADAGQEVQRDKPRFTHKKRFAATHHERLQGTEDAPLFRELAEAVREHWREGNFAGLILLGKPQYTGPLRGLLPKEIEAVVAGGAAHPMTAQPDEIADDASRLAFDWEARREQEILSELNERWKENHLVANGPTDVLDALQQGRATRILLGTRRDIPGAQCLDCGYRFGAPVGVCPYCQGRCRNVSAVQDIMRLSMRHAVPISLFRAADNNPLDRAGGLAAFVRAPANWAPNDQLARASEGHESSAPQGG
jgi:peptide subunit release factor 1 (eRF1)